MNARRQLRRTAYRLIGPKARRKLLRRHYRIRGKKIVNVLHISKTGGTAFKHAVRNNTLTESYALILHSHGIRLEDIPVGENVVFFLRDPVARFVSAFIFQQRQGKPRYDSPWSEEEEVLFAEFHTPNALALALSSGDQSVQQRATHAMTSIKHLRRSQADWIGNEAYFRSRLPDIFLVGFQESLAEDFIRLKTKLGLPDELNLPSDPVLANRTNATSLADLDEEAVDNLMRWYARDYALIALCKEIIPVKEYSPCKEARLPSEV